MASLFVLLALGRLFGEEPNANVGYLAYRFEPGEAWRASAATNAGETRLEGRTWWFDFTRGAPHLALTPPDRTLLTRPERFHLRMRGEAKGHSVHVYFRTHFMTFHKVVGEFPSGDLPQEFVFDAPPGEGWQWFGGENDGKLHGPLRLGEIRLEANGQADRGKLELVEFCVEGRCPTNKLCTMNAEEVSSASGEVFRLNVVSLAPQGLEGVLKWVVRDWDGRELKRGHQALELPGIGARPSVASNSDAGGLRLTHEEPRLTFHVSRFTYDVPVPKRPASQRFAEAEFELAVPGQVVPRVQAYWLASPPGHRGADLQPGSPFGMGVYLCRYSADEKMEEIARKARDAGVKWSRENFSWSRIEPRPGEFHWDYYDRLLDCAQRNGITVYAIVMSWPPWSKAYTSEGVDQYAAFLRRLVSRYHDRIKQWEIWNEPNIFFWQGPKALYAEMLKKSYTAIKETDPAAQVLGLSTAGIDFKFIDEMLRLGAPFDVLTIHPYRKQFDDQAFISDLKRVSAQVKLPEGSPRPVWLTEMGWATHVPHHALRQDFEPVTQRAQAELLPRVYLCSIVSGVEPRTFWYDFRNDGSDPFYFEHNLGTLCQDGRPKPAYLAYATLTQVLEGIQFAGPVDAGAGNFAFRFRSNHKGGREVIAVWNPKSDATVQLKLPGPRAQVINAVGELTERKTLPLASDKTTRGLRLDLKAGAPVYVVAPGPANTGN